MQASRLHGLVAQASRLPRQPGRLHHKAPDDALILKGVHRCGDRGYVDLIVTDLSGNAAMRSESTPFLGLEASDLDRMARAAGARNVALFGGYQDQPFDRQQSVDLVMVAEK